MSGQCFRLRSYDGVPSNGYIFEIYGTKGKRFGPTPVIEGLAKEVWGYRARNDLPRATYKESLVDVDRFQCRARNNDPRICVECDPEQPEHVNMQGDSPGLNGACKGCGVKIE